MVTFIIETATLYDADVLDDASYAAVKGDVEKVLKAEKITVDKSGRGAAIEKWMTKNLLEAIYFYGNEGRVLTEAC
ncbi:hypothetical protein VE00_02162 [Pseudogymnoascus sp. WSF 3629]|nr:hypothetical protein VE00_02162 [Pseudogymnoascus sp. WSF 3629]